MLVAVTGWGGIPGFVAPLVIAISALGLMLPNTSAMALAHFPTVAGSASALLGCIQFTCAAIAAALMGAIQTESTVPVALMIAGGAVLAAGVRWGLARVSERSHLDPPPHRPYLSVHERDRDIGSRPSSSLIGASQRGAGCFAVSPHQALSIPCSRPFHPLLLCLPWHPLSVTNPIALTGD